MTEEVKGVYKAQQTLVLIRGIPGSGKSTLAEALQKVTGDVWMETDAFWRTPNNEYAFDITRLREAHEWCQDQTERYLNDGLSVIVSNTFTTQKEMKPYFEIAKSFGIRPQVILCQGNFGNVHNVPVETLAKMTERFQYDLPDLWAMLD